MEKIDNERINDLIEENKKLKEDLIYEKNFLNENNQTNYRLYKELEILLNNKRELIKVLIKKAEKLQQENNQLKELQQQIIEKDEKIKELEKQLSTATMWHGCDTIISNLKQENQQFKQSQNSKAIEILKDIIKFIENAHKNYYPAPFEIKSFIENQITELGGDKNE